MSVHRPTIIVVEDEPMNRLVAVDFLEEAGFDVVDFGGADEALLFCQRGEQRADALFTDINVPGDRDGIDLAQEIDRRWPHILVLVTSGRFGTTRPKELPARALYMAKPWRAREVVATLRSVLDRR